MSLAQSLNAVRIGLTAVARHLLVRGDATGYKFIEEVLETCRGDDFKNPTRGIARVPECVPLVAGFEHQVAHLGVDHVVVELRSESALDHIAVLVLTAVTVKRRAQVMGRYRVLDHGEATPGLLTPDHEPHAASAKIPCLTILRADDARPLRCIEASSALSSWLDTGLLRSDGARRRTHTRRVASRADIAFAAIAAGARLESDTVASGPTTQLLRARHAPLTDRRLEREWKLGEGIIVLCGETPTGVAGVHHAGGFDEDGVRPRLDSA